MPAPALRPAEHGPRWGDSDEAKDEMEPGFPSWFLPREATLDA